MHRFTVLTGAPGSGKTAILAHLRDLGWRGVDEPARQVLAAQRRAGGRGVPDRDPARFTELLLAHAIDAYRAAGDGPLVFDRGIPDTIAYATWYGLDAEPAWAASREHRYATRVFFAPHWPEIYAQDEERRMTAAEARRFGEFIRDAYAALGYDLVELPRDTVEARARLVQSALSG